MKRHNIGKIIIMKTCFQVYSIDFHALPLSTNLYYYYYYYYTVFTVRTFNGFFFCLTKSKQRYTPARIIVARWSV